MPDARAAWTQSADDPTLGGDVVAYELARAPGPNPTAVVLTVPASFDGDDTEAVDAPGYGTWFYRVRAVNAAGRRSLWSNQVEVTATTVGATLTLHATLRGVPRLRASLRSGPAIRATLRPTHRLEARLLP